MATPESYSPFNPGLDEEFPINNVLSHENTLVVLEGLPGASWNLIFVNSPAQNAETEMLMGDFVVKAVRAGEWTDLPAKKDGVVGKVVSAGGIGSIYEVRSVFEKPQKNLEEIGFVERVLDDEGKEMLKPTRKMVLFIKERLARFFGT